MKTGIFCSVKLYWKWKFLNILFFCWMLVSEKYEWWSNQIKRELAQTTSRNKKLSENDVQLAYYCIASVHRTTSAFHLSTSDVTFLSGHGHNKWFMLVCGQSGTWAPTRPTGLMILYSDLRDEKNGEKNTILDNFCPNLSVLDIVYRVLSTVLTDNSPVCQEWVDKIMFYNENCF